MTRREPDASDWQEARRQARRARYRLGHTAEWLAAMALRLRGYRILAKRERTPLGEIDLIAVRGRRLAFVEVKRRASQQEAEASITAAQRARVRRAAGLWLQRHARYQSHEIGFDIVFLLPRRWPLHLENGL
jgi:putative endonuclease